MTAHMPYEVRIIVPATNQSVGGLKWSFFQGVPVTETRNVGNRIR